MAAKLIALVLPLGLDTFAVSAALGTRGMTSGERWRISFLFMAFEAGMPLIGLAVGAPLGRAIGGAADYLAIAVLLAVGLYTLLASEAAEEERIDRLTRARGFAAFALGVSISVDELAVGFTLGLFGVPVPLVILLIAVQTFVVTQLGLRLGDRLSEHLREGAERIAGAALTGLAIVLLAEKLLA
jgi:putative Mn2+ efflux pump MntP